MKPEWKDVSSHSKRSTDRTPNSFEIQLGDIRLSVHRHIHYEPHDWLASSYPKLLDAWHLLATDAEDAKEEALSLLEASLAVALGATFAARGLS